MGNRQDIASMASQTVPVASRADEVPTLSVEFDRSLGTLPKYFAADGDIVMSHVLILCRC